MGAPFYMASKPHYIILDALRGVAALVVVCYHFGEGFASSVRDQAFNHGYLAVDLFFMLSGFVLGYAYDRRRWESMTTADFIRRRFIRLHPMLVFGVLLGVIAFLIQGSVKWDGSSVQTGLVAADAVSHSLLIPTLPGWLTEIRGNGEAFPLNGPHWSLWFEYLGSFLFALLFRRLSTRWLGILTSLFALALVAVCIFKVSGDYSLGVGWTFGGWGFVAGLIRLLFPFCLGLLMARVFRPVKVKGAFWICAGIIVVALGMPWMGTETNPWLNSLYELACVILVFPVIVWLGASGTNSHPKTAGLCLFLGAISFPLYAVHYPLMYLFYHHVWTNGLSWAQVWPWAVVILLASIAIAWLALKFYDEPLRRRLTESLKKKN
ncbi:MAG: acyltransferase [Bacteroidales bacterium]|nr:acyltransferase [Bacteroidales bacterium]